MYFNRARSILLQATSIAAAMALTKPAVAFAPTPKVEPPNVTTSPQPSSFKKAPHGHGRGALKRSHRPSGSIRQLKRKANSGLFEPPQPTKQEQAKHKWFHNPKAAKS